MEDYWGYWVDNAQARTVYTKDCTFEVTQPDESLEADWDDYIPGDGQGCGFGTEFGEGFGLGDGHYTGDGVSDTDNLEDYMWVDFEDYTSLRYK